MRVVDYTSCGIPNVEGTLIDNTIRKAHAYILNDSATLLFVQQGSDTYTDYPIDYSYSGGRTYPTPAVGTNVDFSVGYPTELTNVLNSSSVSTQAFIDAVNAYNNRQSNMALMMMKEIKSLEDAFGANNNYQIVYEGVGGSSSPIVPQGAQFNPNPTNLDQFGVGGIGNTPTDSGGGAGDYDSSGTTGK